MDLTPIARLSRWISRPRTCVGCGSLLVKDDTSATNSPHACSLECAEEALYAQAW